MDAGRHRLGRGGVLHEPRSGGVAYHALAQAATGVGRGFDASAILPPETGFSAKSMTLQVTFTALILAMQAAVILRGVRKGIQRVSMIVTPILFVTLLIVIVRSVTLPGADEGVRWLLSLRSGGPHTDCRDSAALGQVVFSVGLGGHAHGRVRLVSGR